MRTPHPIESLISPSRLPASRFIRSISPSVAFIARSLVSAVRHLPFPRAGLFASFPSALSCRAPYSISLYNTDERQLEPVHSNESRILWHDTAYRVCVFWFFATTASALALFLPGARDDSACDVDRRLQPNCLASAHVSSSYFHLSILAARPILLLR